MDSPEHLISPPAIFHLKMTPFIGLVQHIGIIDLNYGVSKKKRPLKNGRLELLNLAKLITEVYATLNKSPYKGKLLCP